MNERKWILKVVNKSAYNTIQIALCTIKCIMLIKCNAYAKVYEMKNIKKDSSIAIIATSQSCHFFVFKASSVLSQVLVLSTSR